MLQMQLGRCQLSCLEGSLCRILPYMVLMAIIYIGFPIDSANLDILFKVIFSQFCLYQQTFLQPAGRKYSYNAFVYCKKSSHIQFLPEGRW